MEAKVIPLRLIECARCVGDGWLDGELCRRCWGTGQEREVA